MNRESFEELVSNEFKHIHQLQATKGRDYAGNEDVLANFKRNADNLGLEPEQIWAVYTAKHWDAIMTYCRDRKQEVSEPVIGRLRDLIVYALLQIAMVQERTTGT